MTVASQLLDMYVDGDAGADTNSGSSEGSASVSGTAGATTTSDATIDLSSDTPDLSGVVAGDTIRMIGATDGFNSLEVFEILSVNDGADTLEVNPTPANNTSGVTWHIGGAWKTLAEATLFTKSSSGVDVTINIKGSADYTEKVDWQSANGSTSQPCHWTGYATTPGDGGLFIIDAESSRNLCIGGSGAVATVLANCHSKNSTAINIGGSNAQVLALRNCRSSSAGTVGIRLSTNSNLVGCLSENSGTIGIQDNTTAQCYACTVIGSATDGILLGGGHAVNNLLVSNAGSGIKMTNSSKDQFVIHNTIDGDNDDTTIGIELSSPGIVTMVNNLVYDCATGIQTGESDHEGRKINLGNLLNGNTVDYVSWSASLNEQTGAPLFINEGTDWGLLSGSPAIGNGVSAGFFGWTTNAAGNITIGAMSGPPVSGADWPAAGDVQNGVTFDNGARTGTFTEPGVGNVETGVQYGAAGTEFTGTFDVPTEAQVEEPIGFGAGGTEFTGELKGGEVLPLLEV